MRASCVTLLVAGLISAASADPQYCPAETPGAPRASPTIDPATLASGVVSAMPNSVYGNMGGREVIDEFISKPNHALWQPHVVKKLKSTKASEQYVKRELRCIFKGSLSSGDLRVSLSYSPAHRPIDLIDITSVTEETQHDKQGFVVTVGDTDAHTAKRGVNTYFFTTSSKPNAATHTELSTFFQHLRKMLDAYRAYVDGPTQDERASQVEQVFAADVAKSAPSADLTEWAAALKRLALFYASSPKALDSIHIDYPRFMAGSNLHLVDGSGGAQQVQTLADFLSKLSSLLGIDEQVETVNGPQGVTNYMMKRQACKYSFLFAVLRAPVQNLIIQLEKKMQVVLFDGAIKTGQLAFQPFTAGNVNIEFAGKNVGDLAPKTKNSYAGVTFKVSSPQKVDITVRRVIKLQVQKDSFADVATLAYDLQVKVSDLPTGPQLGPVSLTFADPTEDSFNAELGEPARTVLRQRMATLSQAFGAAAPVASAGTTSAAAIGGESQSLRGQGRLDGDSVR